MVSAMAFSLLVGNLHDRLRKDYLKLPLVLIFFCLVQLNKQTRTIAFFLLAFLCGCSSFNRDWRRAAVPAPSENSMEGRWEGRWTSDANHHHGGLRCLMVQESNSIYQARFRATYGKIFHFNYTARLETEPHYG